MSRLALLAMVLVACAGGGQEASGGRDLPPPAAGGTPSPTAGTTGAGAGGVGGVGGVGTPDCPATGRWARCSLLQRLDRAGLAPRVDSGPVSEPPLTESGALLRVGNAELEVYLYPDAGTRERDEARLDRARYVAYAAPMPPRPLPTLIASANLIAILHSRNDHQRERVGDAISAGPPQPIRP